MLAGEARRGRISRAICNRGATTSGGKRLAKRGCQFIRWLLSDLFALCPSHFQPFRSTCSNRSLCLTKRPRNPFPINHLRKSAPQNDLFAFLTFSSASLKNACFDLFGTCSILPKIPVFPSLTIAPSTICKNRGPVHPFSKPPPHPVLGACSILLEKKTRIT